DNTPIKVGPTPAQKWDFDVLQGARTTLAAADFDRDGKVDLVVGDTYGKLRYYRNLTGGVNPTFASPEVIADLHMRVVPSIADWNEDGDDDLMAIASYGYLCWYERSFLEHGYASAEVKQLEGRPE